MAISTDSIIDPTSTVPANSEEAAPAEDTSGVPESVLGIPIMQGLLNGSPPAIWAEIGTKSPEIAEVLKHGKSLNEIGIGFFRDSKAGLDLAYNTRFIQPSLVEAAAKKGKLKDLGEPFLETNARFNEAAGLPTTGAAAPAASGGMPSSVPVDSPLATARKDNLMPGSPSSGNFPGRGRVINEITKNTV